MTLSDGTKVWLNSETEMKYPVVFDRGKREVFITGEAFFEVVKDSARPFIVHTPHTHTTVPVNRLAGLLRAIRFWLTIPL